MWPDTIVELAACLQCGDNNSNIAPKFTKAAYYRAILWPVEVTGAYNTFRFRTLVGQTAPVSANKSRF